MHLGGMDAGYRFRAAFEALLAIWTRILAGLEHIVVSMPKGQGTDMDEMARKDNV